jgi:hypothetical protein
MRDRLSRASCSSTEFGPTGLPSAPDSTETSQSQQAQFPVKTKPSWYIVATKDRSVQPELQRFGWVPRPTRAAM